MDTQDIIFHNLFNNDEYARSVLPYIQEEYLTDKPYRIIFNQYSTFFGKYNVPPTIESFVIDLENVSDLSQDDYNEIVARVTSYKEEVLSDFEWLLDTTEAFCSERAVFNAIQASIKIISGEDEKNTKGAIPELLQEALAVSFDNSVGHEYLDDVESRYDFLHRQEDRISFGIDMMDKLQVVDCQIKH